jgi:DNA-binding MarR family transcriptional regulator
MLMLLRLGDGASRVARDGLGVAEDRDVEILLITKRDPGISPGAIATETGAAPSVISRTLSRLEGRDLLRRKARADDARGRGVWLTRTGARRVRDLDRRFDEFFRDNTDLMTQALGLLRPKGRAGAARAGGEAATSLELAENLVGLNSRLAVGASRTIKSYGVDNGADRLALTFVEVNGPVRPHVLADALALTTGGVTLLLDRLERRDLVRRAHDAVATDRRAVVVSLTPRGRRAVAGLVAALEPLTEAYSDALAAILSR